MTGSNGTRGDDGDGGLPPGGGRDPCDKIWLGSITSPKSAVLAGAKVDDVLDVIVDKSGARPVLAVERAGSRAGSLTFVGYLGIINCIEHQGRRYRAVLTKITGGVHEVRVEPV